MIIEVPKGYTFSTKKEVIAFEENSMLKLKKRPFKFEYIMYDLTYKLKGNRKCYYCGRIVEPSQITLDHVYAKGLGGPTIPQNMVPSCKKCNEEKENMTPDQFRVYMSLKDDGAKEQFKREYFKIKMFQIRWLHMLPKEWISRIPVSSLIVTIDLPDTTTNKYKKINEYYTRCGKFPKPIIVDKNNFVLDGFTVVLYARNNRIKEIPAIVLENVEVIF